MKRNTTFTLLSVLAFSTGSLCAQENPPSHRQHPAPGIFGILDANRDGTLDPDEIGRAGEVLRRFDRNNDRRIALDELTPAEGGQRPPHGDAQSDRGPRRDGDRDARPSGGRQPDRRKDGDHARRSRGDERCEHCANARRDDHRAHPPQARDRQQAHRPPQDGDRRDHRRNEKPRIAPHMEGAHRPPMHPPQHSQGHPRLDAKPRGDQDRPQHDSPPHGGSRPPGQPPHGPVRSQPGAI